MAESEHTAPAESTHSGSAVGTIMLSIKPAAQSGAWVQPDGEVPNISYVPVALHTLQLSRLHAKATKDHSLLSRRLGKDVSFFFVWESQRKRLRSNWFKQALAKGNTSRMELWSNLLILAEQTCLLRGASLGQWMLPLCPWKSQTLLSIYDWNSIAPNKTLKLALEVLQICLWNSAWGINSMSFELVENKHTAAIVTLSRYSLKA